MSTVSKVMIFMLVPTGNSEWMDMRHFTSYSALEQVMKQGIKERLASRKYPQWCFGIAYEGTDELYPVFEFHITDQGDIQRTIPSPLVS